MAIGLAQIGQAQVRLREAASSQRPKQGHAGFGDNARPIEWALRRIAGEVEADPAITGKLPLAGDLNVDGLSLDEDAVRQIFELDPDAWAREADLTEEYFAQFGDHLPDELNLQLVALRQRIADAKP
jgi:phosphoenolpyruvate carboxykinase (GTP)